MSMPARNAPSARERPADCVIQASPSATKSTKRTKSSDDFWLATTWNNGRITRWPTTRTTARTTAALTSATTSSEAMSAPSAESAGTRTRSGITARSWKSSTPMICRPWGVCSCMRSASVFETIAVEDIASMPPTTMPARQSSPARRAAKNAASPQTATCAPPNPSTSRRMEESWGRLNSSPTENMRNTTPNSASERLSSVSATRPSALGPMSAPTTRYPRIAGMPSRRNTTTTATAEASRISATVSASVTFQAPTRGTPGSIISSMTNLLQPHALSDAERLLALARDVLDIEADAVRALKDRLGESFLAAHRLMRDTKGRVVVTGMGKSGHIGNKIAATLASTGTPAFFMHPAEASHGDLGMITPDDVVIAISYSGESDEIARILPLIKRRGAKVIAITGRADSTLARESDVHLDARVEKEACPLELAPTASTTATLALGDALAMALLDSHGFKSEDFAQHHPGGALGRRLLVHVSDVMRKGDKLPVSREGDPLLPTALEEMSRKG